MKNNDLTQGNIFQSLWRMAVPLILASFIQMAYNMTDMLWLGHLSSHAVAAAGAAGFFIWLGNSLSLMTKTGAEITISQALGAKDKKRAHHYVKQSTTLSILFGMLYGCFLIIAAPTLIGLFHFEPEITQQAVDYLRIVAPGLFFQFNNNTFCGIYNGQGDSRTPFRITAIGLVANIILDPILIYGWGPIPQLGVIGAAIATSIAQFVVFFIFCKFMSGKQFVLKHIKLFNHLKTDSIKRILFLGLPVSFQNALFSMFSLTLSTLAARWGAVGVAAQSIGSQIEAISWMTAAGFSTALAAFTGQNYGAQLYERIRKGYYLTLQVAGSFGLLSSLLFFLFDKEIFSLFVEETHAIEVGGDYLKILAFSQLFMVTESVTAGAFYGTGHTTPPSLIGIIFNALRIPLAFWLISFPTLGLNGIWWSITFSSILKGTLLPIWYLHFQHRKIPRNQ